MNLEYIYSAKPYNNVCLDLGLAQFKGDSFYLVQIFCGNERKKDAKYSVDLLREFWFSKVHDLKDYEFLFLPFGFEDQGSTWFKIEAYPGKA